MADAALTIHFVWVEADWGEAIPLKGGSEVNRSAYAVSQADSRQPALAMASRQVGVGSDVEQALAAHLSEQALRRLASGEISAAIFGRRARSDQALYAGDRIELLGPISADPKDARRARVQHERQVSSRDKWKTTP